eukprot:CAMPEP_0176230896 /NCGR_PEP_ID=MMETSP0121_2-20121125/24527_1 /TAXON_ID=160619 /ORGANISM="Kryptoperidinium foliaceum, Strain CCMP 1326" /LENGTH=429 /DNA_ID=CAMNT_0017570237 /DNA_START=1 /DNA_END=1290 /DNA_ORIENTATION=+
MLSNSLRADLRFEIQRRHLASHPLFYLALRIDATTVSLLSRGPMVLVHLRANDELFLPGAGMENAFCLVDGQLRYSQSPMFAPVDEEETTKVDQGRWICEAALWSEWTTVGQADAICSSQLLSLPSSELQQVMQGNPSIAQIFLEYARQYHKRIIHSRPPHAPWPTDLHVPFTEYYDLVSSMDQEVQVVIGSDAVAFLRKTGRVNAAACTKLGQEVSKGKSIVVLTGDGSVVRVVSIIAIKVDREDGRFLAQIGKMDADGTLHTSCQLPGGKRERNELVEESLQRVIAKKEKMLLNNVELVQTVCQTVEKQSKEFGIQTRYLRTICSMRLAQEERLQAVRCKVCPPENDASEGTMMASLSSRRWWTAALDCEVLAFSENSGAVLYAWMTQPEFDFFSGPSGDATLRAWVGAMQWESPAEEVADFDARVV